MDEPIADTAFITTFLVSEFARQDVTVILSGVGGDELFGGYRRYLGSHYQRYLGWLPGAIRRLLAGAALRLPSDRHSPLLNVARLARGYLTTADLPFEQQYRSYVEVFPPAEIEQLLRANGFERFDAIDASFRFAAGDDDLNRMLIVDAETQLPDDLLLLTDKMSMAVSLECRVPLLDHDLVELAASLPESTKIKGGRLKHVMKEAMKDLLPADILNRKKRGFGTPMGAWMKSDLAPVVRSLLSPRSVDNRGLFRSDVVTRLIEDHQASRVDGTDRLLALLNLEIWSRIFLDRRTPADVTQELKALAA
jgi:asparagine synthase (glutamine-hydrolysing)